MWSDPNDRGIARRMLHPRLGIESAICRLRLWIQMPDLQLLDRTVNMCMKRFLQRRHVPFEVVSHAAAYDAQHLAQALHTPGREVAKTVLLRANHAFRYIEAEHPLVANFARLTGDGA